MLESRAVAPVYDPTCNAFFRGQKIEVATREALPFCYVKYIGQGSSAVIEMVLHEPANQLFALKTFRRYHGGHFENHIHIIQVWGTYICDREPGILLSPTANGGDLAAYLARVFGSGMTSEHDVILNRTFGCLASVLAYIHKHTIRHKDNKPQNILIHDGRVIYTDFGISFDADQQDTTTIGYPSAFTRRYCAPESDVYSLGCVFVEILDVLEPRIGFRCMDRLPYFQKLDEVRQRLVQASATVNARKGLLRICHDMLESNQVDRIDTGSVLWRITNLGSPKDQLEIGLFCHDCSAIAECKDMATQKELVDDFTVLSLNVNPNTDIVSSEAETESTATKAAKKPKNKKRGLHKETATLSATVRATAPTNAEHATKSDTKQRTARMNAMLAAR
ncbi:kinase-like protein [Lentithecium fluviatile CBS 122367]|uniref:non-specific serine/threonine protein kinase n=1 Tax=Lentithecium fluviatile CBS 122367 TaxID=1168545 RepID=A0A6G1IG32_9PLEO|nr:kinase-like protein [Lentithecium fluviatile CBS 122367]